ncbi:MAG: isopentenyl phosphate kinase [Candidatus Curtissbacteria bacterium]|nr:isopentenyl phosphate kinase [Candidatus Curtissbacteria bacterium]
MQNLILIKLGGSTITDKSKRKGANLKIINQLAREIESAREKTRDLIIIGHGQGSYAHVPAKKYQTKKGNIHKNSDIGLAKVRLECLELNSIVIDRLITAGIPAVTFEPHSFLLSINGSLSKIFVAPIVNALGVNLVPVVYGDAIQDEKIGWTIFSGEQILNLLALNLKNQFKIKTVIEVGNTNGVLDKVGKIITQINAKNFKSVEKYISGSSATDVTGGMEHKVKEALVLAQKGIHTQLISAKTGNLSNAILGRNASGTWIR